MDRPPRREADHRISRSRSRSPAPSDERRGDDRRRERSPFRGGARGRGRGSGTGPGRDENRRRREEDTPPPPPRTSGADRGNRRGAPDHHTHPAPRKAATQRPSQPRLETQQPDEDDEAFMTRVLGFGAFRSTKDTKVPGNEKNYAVHKVKKTEYRQYMNRVGGFNRPLSPTRL
ncbi:hypothetical protein LTR62_001716 [Meristemomyces frigidus]|uniref:U4/U6.U5 small nuclear ribonucleoprotein 27kDa protein domain-containing protein n=1 Tax=Meristemomyces frigidus TaxID=1508187 RepID=A0AAN7T930_9PEZI|nr:hypothetical protein LTR62_001716 [Meristemomyces frigidus]